MSQASPPPGDKRIRVRLTPAMKAYLAAESKKTGIPENQLLQMVVARSNKEQKSSGS